MARTTSPRENILFPLDAIRLNSGCREHWRQMRPLDRLGLTIHVFPRGKESQRAGSSMVATCSQPRITLLIQQRFRYSLPIGSSHPKYGILRCPTPLLNIHQVFLRRFDEKGIPNLDPTSRLDSLLKKKASQGVRIYVLPWSETKLAMGLNSKNAKLVLGALHGVPIQMLRLNVRI